MYLAELRFSYGAIPPVLREDSRFKMSLFPIVQNLPCFGEGGLPEMKKRRPVFEVDLRVHIAVGADLLIRYLPAVLAIIKVMLLILTRVTH